jgi:hypothetical protein
MSEAEKDAHTDARERRTPSPKSLSNLRPWPKGVSGNPGGAPPRARLMKRARRYTQRMLNVLVELAENPKEEPEVRRKSALGVLHEGWGNVPSTQEVVRPQTPVGPLVALNFGGGGAQTPTDIYKLMAAGLIEADPNHPAFRSQRPPIETERAATATPSATTTHASSQAVESADAEGLSVPVFESGGGTHA